MGDVACHFVLVAFCVHRYIGFFNVSAFVFYFPVDALFRRCAPCRLPVAKSIQRTAAGRPCLPIQNRANHVGTNAKMGPCLPIQKSGNRGVLTTRTHTLAVVGSSCALLSPHTHTYYFTLCLLRSTSHSPRSPPRPLPPRSPPLCEAPTSSQFIAPPPPPASSRVALCSWA